MTDPRQEGLREDLRALGFDAVRFARLDPPLHPVPLRNWIDAGMHADMAWMERTADKRLDPTLVLPGAMAAILLGVSTWSAREVGQPGAPVWARYARYEDYHDTIKPALVAAGRLLEARYGIGADDYRYYVDAGPVLERAWAARAGVGFVGKNAMLISREHGNWLLLSAILVRVPFEPDAPLGKVRAPDRERSVGLLCGSCTRCLDACPTNAFAAPGVVDARRCISYQTIENRGIIPRELRASIGPRVFGCDTCLDVCPWNRFAREGRRVLLVAREEIGDLKLRDLLTLTPERFAAVFRRTPIKRTKLTGILRNACIAAGNSGDSEMLPQLCTLAVHESPIVRAHAVWAVFRLAGANASELLRDARARETDASVLSEYAAESAGLM